MDQEKKIAFIKLREFSHTNASVLNILRNNFPEYRIDVIDVLTDLIGKRDPFALIHCFKTYGIDILTGRKSFSSVYFRTTYIYKKIRNAALKRLRGKGYSFTFQTQSLFDASLPGVPHFLYTDHTHLANLTYPGFDRKHLLSERWIECEKEIYQHATVNFTMSSNISASMIEDYNCDRERVACVYCGSNVQVGDDESFDDSRYFKKDILFVGIEWERKGGPALAEAFKSLIRKYPDATLTIVGCSPDLNLPNCTVTGRIPLQEVKKYFEKASLFCLPTTIEPFGIVFLEAMAHKLPVIGTKIGAIPDFIHEGRNGFLVEPGNTEQIVKGISEVFDSPDKAKAFGEYGQKLFRERYTWEKTGLKITEHIRKHLE